MGVPRATSPEMEKDRGASAAVARGSAVGELERRRDGHFVGIALNGVFFFADGLLELVETKSSGLVGGG